MDENLLGKIDEIRSRLNVSYLEARQALEEKNGDLLEAIILLEGKGVSRPQKQKETIVEEFEVFGGELVERVKELVRQGNLTKVRILHKGKLILEVPITAGAILLLAPQLAIVAGAALLFDLVTLQVERVNCEGGATEPCCPEAGAVECCEEDEECCTEEGCCEA